MPSRVPVPDGETRGGHRYQGGNVMAETPASSDHHTIVIVGGGAAGITVAALLLRHNSGLDVAIVEPSDTHYYQPAFTLVGAGAYPMAATARPERSLIPARATWIKDKAEGFDPDKNAVALAGGAQLSYDWLVCCPGLKVDPAAVEGLNDALGSNNITTNYRPDCAPYTWQCLQNIKAGDTAIFTMPPMPIKCPGAPQKIAYLAADLLRRKGLAGQVDIEYCTATPAMFSVPYFAGPLLDVARSYGINVNFKTNLKAIDADAKTATFAVTNEDDSVTEVTKSFDMIHVTPPQCAPDALKGSALGNDAGWVDIDQHSMKHVRFENVYALGDAGSTPNSKTAAAVRKQAFAVVHNLLADMKQGERSRQYDGYGSCPLTTSYGKVMLAEFTYGGKVTPSFPMDPKVCRTSMWWLKKKFLPYLYWSHMLKGKEFDIAHRERGYS